MAQEIEKKYLVDSNIWLNLVEDDFFIKQGYFKDSDNIKKRIRLINDDRAILGHKLPGVEQDGFVKREENEHDIDYFQGVEIFSKLNRFISKHRHIIPIQQVLPFEVLNAHPILEDLKVEVDVFLNLNKALTMAEIEVKEEQIKDFNAVAQHLPSWFSKDVSLDDNYSNSRLIKLTPLVKTEESKEEDKKFKLK
jgi:CYTH domain-containing protein